MTKIGFHTRISNPLTKGYYAYLACIDSWRKVAGEVVVVDGGSNDGSIELLCDWIDNDPKVRILSNAMSHWGGNFAWEQSTLNMQLGQEELDSCDWIIRTDADHVLDTRTAQHLGAELESCDVQGYLNVAFPVLSFWNGRYHYRSSPRNWIINNRVAKLRGVRVGWGKDEETGSLSDCPLLISREESFIDPETGMTKPLLVGSRLVQEFVCAIRVYKYGHFFFTKEQCIAKCRVWDRVVVGFLGKRPKSRLEILLDSNTIGITRYVTKSALLSISHPPEARRLMEQYYQTGMLGGALYFPGVRLVLLALRLLVRMQHGLHRFGLNI